MEAQPNQHDKQTAPQQEEIKTNETFDYQSIGTLVEKKVRKYTDNLAQTTRRRVIYIVFSLMLLYVVYGLISVHRKLNQALNQHQEPLENEKESKKSTPNTDPRHE